MSKFLRDFQNFYPQKAVLVLEIPLFNRIWLAQSLLDMLMMSYDETVDEGLCSVYTTPFLHHDIGSLDQRFGKTSTNHQQFNFI